MRPILISKYFLSNAVFTLGSIVPNVDISVKEFGGTK